MHPGGRSENNAGNTKHVDGQADKSERKAGAEREGASSP